MARSNGHQFFIFYLLFLFVYNYWMSYVFIYLLYVYIFGLFGVFTNFKAACLGRGHWKERNIVCWYHLCHNMKNIMPSTSYVPNLLRASSPTSRGPLAPRRLCLWSWHFSVMQLFQTRHLGQNELIKSILHYMEENHWIWDKMNLVTFMGTDCQHEACP